MRTELHFHLLPGVDDGPTDDAEAIELARLAIEDGTSLIVVTPHVRLADIEAKGLLDIFVSNITEPYALEESNFAFINTGDRASFKRGLAPFVDKSERLGLSRGGWAWTARSKPSACWPAGFPM